MVQRTTISRLLAEINRTMRLLPYQGPGRHRVRTLSAAVRVFVLQTLIARSSNEALPQTDEVYAEDGALIAIANDRWTPIEPAGTMP
jgi:predicted DNA-binding ribbon-helix-helix protein